VWREVGGQERLAAKIENGSVKFLGFDSAGGIAVLQPVRAVTSSAWIVPCMLVAIAVLLLSVIAWPVAALVRRRYGVSLHMDARRVAAHRLARVAAMIAVVFLLGWALIVQAGLADLAKFGGAMDAPILLFQILGWVALVGCGCCGLECLARVARRCKVWSRVLEHCNGRVVCVDRVVRIHLQPDRRAAALLICDRRCSRITCRT
jgi:hypothetical protein